ncbi:unnamed protein product [Phyllotreta striolata]|uniref:UDP-glucuronosyltransferase n=1 Tax=Phyllotreta striolata TaxID=444603 RepID=A0A9N9XN68_PHYSR|nr:unnamed protein product [Phyllotreta striolata]
MPQWNAMAKETFGKDTEDIQTIEKHIPVLLANLMLGFHYSQPLTPNIIPVGGLHIRSPKGLPEDLQEIYNEAENGVVYFSLGTNIRTNELDVEKIEMFKETFGRLNVTVIWKIDFQLKDCPENVYLQQFLPQNEILAHPKTRAFISHCGGLSTMESVHHGVPVIGMPFIVDQHFLGTLIEKRELGVILEYETLTADVFYEAIQKVLNNEMRKEKRQGGTQTMAPDSEYEWSLDTTALLSLDYICLKILNYTVVVRRRNAPPLHRTRRLEVAS